MTEHRSDDIRERRRIYNHIKTLESECENLTNTIVNLTDRLERLDNVVDKMIAEKDAPKRHDACIQKTDVLSYHGDHHNQQNLQQYSKQLPTSSSNGLIQTKSHDDLNYNSSSLRRVDQNICQKTPSDAFKLKLSLCLQEISSKADDIFNLSQQLRGR